jgi:DHA2 family multidrug resistance protein
MAASATMGTVPATPAATDQMDPRKLIAFFAMVVGMFMSILDIQIVSASLAEIQAGLSAGTDEIGWVQTSYLIAEVIMIPLSGTLARIISTRYLFALSAAGFTAASALCATATNIDQMIVYRAIQGADRRRLSQPCLFLALAVSGQHHSRHHRDDRHVEIHRFRQA